MTEQKNGGAGLGQIVVKIGPWSLAIGSGALAALDAEKIHMIGVALSYRVPVGFVLVSYLPWLLVFSVALIERKERLQKTEQLIRYMTDIPKASAELGAEIMRALRELKSVVLRQPRASKPDGAGQAIIEDTE